MKKVKSFDRSNVRTLHDELKEGRTVEEYLKQGEKRREEEGIFNIGKTYYVCSPWGIGTFLEEKPIIRKLVFIGKAITEGDRGVLIFENKKHTKICYDFPLFRTYVFTNIKEATKEIKKLRKREIQDLNNLLRRNKEEAGKLQERKNNFQKKAILNIED